MVVLVTIQSNFVDSNILETSQGRPNTPPSLKCLEKGVHELVGQLTPLPPLDNVVGSKRLRPGRVKVPKTLWRKLPSALTVTRVSALFLGSAT